MPPSSFSPNDDLANDHDHVLSPQNDHEEDEMEDLALSPTMPDIDNNDDNEESSSGSRLIPLSMMSDGAGSSSDRPLPSLQTPITFRDLQFVGVYAFHVLLMLLATGYIRAEFTDDSTITAGVHPSSPSEDSVDVETIQEMNASDIGIQLRSLSAVNLLFSFGWLLIYLCNAKIRFIQASYIFSTVGLSILTLTCFSVHNNSNALTLSAIAATAVILDVLWIKRTKNGFDFVAVLFELIVDFLLKYPSIAMVTVGTLVAYTMWECWICTSLGFVGNGASPWQFSMLFLYLHFYWTSNIFKNVLTVVVSGATMIWYFQDDSSDLTPQTSAESSRELEEGETTNSSLGTTLWNLVKGNERDRKVIFHYLRCALTSSFGSLCIGSLLCPLAHIIWNILRWARRDDSMLSKRFAALHSETVEQFIRTYHKYSLVHIAAYGKPFYVAAHDSWNLIEKRGVEAIVDDDLTSHLLGFGPNGWASIMCTLCIPAFSTTQHVVFFAMTSFILSYTTLSIATQIMGAVIKTLFVCFAENPGRLSQLHPLIYHRFARLTELKSFRDHKTPHSFVRS